ncbi:cupredoxin domain-containing protein [Sorangium sp. So ce854]|uniref:cupredoxin domain-containing protein n=1 Tax=Sorangium sp. So ce854 TaxID=3133322 RepID=UPI003F60B3CA
MPPPRPYDGLGQPPSLARAAGAGVLAAGIRKELPTGQSVTIDLPELRAGALKFACGMGMIKGTIPVAPKK